jgi:hypothetical protein
MNLSQLARAIALNLTAFADANDSADNVAAAPDIPSTPAAGDPVKRGRGRPPKNAAPPAEAPAQESLDLGNDAPADDGDMLAELEPTPPPKPTAPAGATVEDLHLAFRALVDKHGKPAAQAILARCKVAKLSEIKPESYAKVIAAVKVEVAKAKAK